MKKNYIKPEVLTVELDQRAMILAGSTDPEGMEKEIILDEEVDYSF